MSDCDDPQAEVFPRQLRLRRCDAERNMNRYYRMRVERDLFGGTSLIREWGRIGTRGHMLIEPHRDEGEAITALMRLARVTRRRGYQG